jgi:phage portal protein BeeE
VGLFRTKAPPSFGASQVVRAAAGGAGRPGTFVSSWSSTGAQRAMSVPTVARAVGLITSTIGGLEIRPYSVQYTNGLPNRLYIEPERWHLQPDPNTTRNWIIAQTVRDLMLEGRAFWYVTARYANGFPSAFTWLPAASVQTADQVGPEWFGPSSQLTYQGVELPAENVVQFLSPIPPMLWYGSRAIDIAYRLDEAAKRFASVEIAAGYLQQTDGEPMSSDELVDLASAWSEARQNRAVGALNQHVEWREFKSNPSTLQLHEGRQHAAMELARVMQVPPWLVGLSVGGMTYQNSVEARRDLFLFGAKPFVDCIEETLSMNSVSQRGRYVELDINTYLLEASQDPSDPDDVKASPKEIAEIVQKIYLGVVNGVISAEEARRILNEAGADLPVGTISR